jgi:hypothetical protein
MNTQPAKPTPELVDDVAKQYIAIQEELLQKQLALTKETETARARLEELSKQLLAWCVDFGSAHEKKSKLLVGLGFEVMTTVSASSSLDQAAVDLFMKACKAAGKTRVFGKIFERISYWRTRPEADQIARGTGVLTPALMVKLVKCSVVTTSAPRLAKVRPRKGTESAKAS